MDTKEKRRIAVGAGLLGLAGLGLWLVTRGQGEPIPPVQPPIPDGEESGRVQGYIVDSVTGAKISDAKIYVDGLFQLISWVDGSYRTAYITYGSHEIRVEADDYQVGVFNVVLEEQLMNMDLALEPLPQAPTDWTEGVEVLSIDAEPKVLYVGESVDIEVYIHYPDPLPLPVDITGTVLVNGTGLTDTWPILFRNPTLRFPYTPTQAGVFTVRTQDKSTTFTVLDVAVGTYYWPYGGIRMPVCTELTVPDVDRFPGHEGGDYTMTGWGNYYTPIRNVKKRLADAYPTGWDPNGVVIRNYSIHFDPPHTDRLIVIASDYDCPQYWDGKEELAQVIARRFYLAPMSAWEGVNEMYGETCEKCGGTGRVPCEEVGWPGDLCPCPECGADGWRVFVDPVRGVRDFQRRPNYGTVGSQGSYAVTLDCPRCSRVFQGPMREIGHGSDSLALAKTLLEHIEQEHRQHPLTERAWYE